MRTSMQYLSFSIIFAGTWSAVTAYMCATGAVLLGVVGGLLLPLLSAAPAG